MSPPTSMKININLSIYFNFEKNVLCVKPSMVAWYFNVKSNFMELNNFAKNKLISCKFGSFYLLIGLSWESSMFYSFIYMFSEIL
jgi:hypothetical protein